MYINVLIMYMKNKVKVHYRTNVHLCTLLSILLCILMQGYSNTYWGEDRQGGIKFDIIIIERVHLFCTMYINLLIMYMNM